MSEIKTLTEGIGIAAEGKEREKAPSESEAWLPCIFQYLSEIIAILETDMTIRYITPSLERVLGYKPEELIRKNILKYIHPDDVPPVKEKIAKAAQQSAFPPPLDLRIRHQDGNWRNFELTVNNLLDEPNIKAIAVNFRDDLKREKGENALRESEKRYRLIVETAAEGIWLIDSEKKTAFVNQRMADMLGYKTDEILGQPLLTFIMEEYKNSAKAQIESRHEDSRLPRDVKFRRRDGTVVWAIASCRPILDDKGYFAGSLCMITDITERKKAQDVLTEEKERAERLAAELEKANKELKLKQEQFLQREKIITTGALAAGVAHEIRNPLAVIGMTVQYLQSKLPENDPRRELTEAIVKKVERLDRVTKELSSYGGTISLNLRKHNLARCLNMNLALIKPRCRIQGIKIRKRYSRMPLVEMDNEQMDKVFFNIMDNAVHAMPEDGILTISTEYNEESRTVIVAIHNTGPIIKKRHLPHIFKPFYTAKKKEGGTGLGLAIAQNVILRHGGKIAIQNKTRGKDKGVAFFVHIPISTSPRIPSEGMGNK